jgi:Fur family peroxide stress response transcriptional regulator
LPGFYSPGEKFPAAASENCRRKNPALPRNFPELNSLDNLNNNYYYYLYMKRERKHSNKRDAILKVIQGTTEHPGAQWVYEKLKPRIPDLSLGTVYRNINLFRHEGLVMPVGVVNGEERFDGVVEPHPHLVCGCCGKVIDLPRPETHIARALLAAGFLTPETGQDRSARLRDGEAEAFTVDYRRTVFYGLCQDCGSVRKTTA